jgi:hypothetical protein
MKKLTNREKILIFLLLCFGIVMGGYYLMVVPNHATYQKLNVLVDEAQFTKNTISSGIENIPAVQKTLEESNEKYGMIRDDFSGHLPNEGLDILLTQLCLGHTLKPITLNVDFNAWQGIPSFTEAPLLVEIMPVTGDGQNIETTSEVSTEESQTNESASGPGMWVGAVTMSLSGTQYDFQRLIDTVNARPDMMIASFEIQPNSEAIDETTTYGNTTTDISYSGWTPELDGGNVSINIVFQVLMVNK